MFQGKKIILIVDDYSDDRLLARKILEKDGFAVEEACGWKDAMVVIKSKKIDIVLLDLKMPEMSGYELLGVIRQEKSNKELPVLIYSSMPRNEDEITTYKPDGFVSKYSTPEELIKHIKKLLAQ